MNNYNILKLSDGGFMVTDGWQSSLGTCSGPRFASTTIEEALRFIKQKLEPKQVKP